MENGEVEKIKYNFFFTTLTELVNDLNKYKYSFNIINKIRYHKYTKRLKKSLCMLFNWKRIDETIMLDFINFIESNEDIFPKDRFIVRHLPTEDIIDFYANDKLYNIKGTNKLSSLLHINQLRVNHRQKKFIIDMYDGFGYRKVIRIKFSDLSYEKDNSIRVILFSNIFYACCLAFVNNDYNTIEEIFNIVNDHSNIYYKSENQY